MDLHGFGKTPAREPHEVLAGLVASLCGPGRPGSARPIPEHLGDRAALLRSMLADRRVLLMIDNARDAEQVLPLLPGDGRCAVVVTSRSTLTDLPGAVHVGLRPLDADGQRELLRTLVGDDRVIEDPLGAEAILRACGGLPLALRISAARLASRPAWSLSTLARQLDGVRGRLPALVAGHLALQSTFSTSYLALRDSERLLEREAARAFRLLGLWPGHEFTPNAAAALLSRSVDEAMELLEFLADAHLVQSPQPLRYQLHDLLGEYAAERAAEEEDAAEREAANLRLMRWYLLTMEEAGLLTGVGRNRAPRLGEPAPAPLPEFGDAEEARRWCVEELPNIKQAVREAAVSARPDFAWRLAVWMFAYGASYWWTGEWDECLQTGFNAAQAHDDLLGQAWSLTRMGIRYGMAFRSEEAVVMFEATLVAMEKLDDGAGKASTLMNLSLAHQQAGRYDVALGYARDAWELYERVHGDIEDAYLIAAFGTALLMGEEYAEAESFLRTAQTLLEERGNATAVATNLANLGDTLRGLGRRDEALELLDQSLELRRKVGDIGGLSNGLAIKGRIHAYFEELEAARDALSEALRLAVEHQLPSSMADHARDRLEDAERRLAARVVECVERA
ncbi:tetratricopeptide repeat protein [Catenulispora yoronensis]